MDTLIHADIFFFITTIAVGIMTVVLCVAGFYVIGILRDAKYVSRKLRHAVDELEGDFEALRSEALESGRKAKYVVTFFLDKFLGKKRSSGKKSD